jgi:hypothetical protein
MNTTHHTNPPTGTGASRRQTQLRRLLDSRHGLRTTAIFGGPHPTTWTGPLRSCSIGRVEGLTVTTGLRSQIGDRVTTSLRPSVSRSLHFLTALIDPKSRQLLWGCFCRRCLKGVPPASKACLTCGRTPETATLR